MIWMQGDFPDAPRTLYTDDKKRVMARVWKEDGMFYPEIRDIEDKSEHQTLSDAQVYIERKLGMEVTD